MIHTFVLRRGALFALVAALAAVGLAIPATPASAEVTSLTGCQRGPITVPGTYRLDADAHGALFCFSIVADNVTLLLNGHTISGTRGQGGSIGVFASGFGDTISGPGTVSGWVEGIQLAGNSGKVRGVTANGNNTGTAIVTSTGNDVRGNVVTGNAVGIEVQRTALVNTIIGNFAHNNGTDLRDDNFNCDGNVWLGNDFGTSFPAQPSCIH